MELWISGVIGLLFGALLTWLALGLRTAAAQARLSLLEKELSTQKGDLARLLEDPGVRHGEQLTRCLRVDQRGAHAALRNSSSCASSRDRSEVTDVGLL